jgi:hypothetical protein
VKTGDNTAEIRISASRTQARNITAWANLLTLIQGNLTDRTCARVEHDQGVFPKLLIQTHEFRKYENKSKNFLKEFKFSSFLQTPEAIQYEALELHNFFIVYVNILH